MGRNTCVESPGGGPAQMSGRWLIPAAGYYGVPTGKNGVAKMASLRLQIGAQITRKYAHNLLIDLYMSNSHYNRLTHVSKLTMLDQVESFPICSLCTW